MAITEKIKRKHQLPSGHWQLFSFGSLKEEAIAKSAIWIWAFFRRVSVDGVGQIIAWHEEVAFDVLPVAELVMFEVGCVFHSDTGRVYSSRKLCEKIENRIVEVEFTEQNCFLMRRHMRCDTGDFLFKNPRLIAEEESNSYLLSSHTSDGTKLLIPCVTILQAFWGRSSNLMHMLLDGRFTEFDRYVLNPKRSFLSPDTKEAFVWLRQWQQDLDAGFLATIAFDKVAVQRGKDISLRLNAHINEFRNNRARSMAVLPPHSEKIRLEVQGLQIKTAYENFFYVQRIIQSSYRPPFTKVTFDRDNDGRRYVDENGIAQEKKPAINRERAPSIPRKEGQSTFEFVSEPPGLFATEDPTPLGCFDPIFPGIAELEIEKLEQEATDFESTQEEIELAADTRWAEKLSVLPSSARSSQDIVQTSLTSAKFSNDSPDDNNTQQIGNYLDLLVEAIDQLEDEQNNLGTSPDNFRIGNGYEFAYKHCFPWKAAPIRGGNLAFSLPAEINDESFAWLYSDPDKTFRKRAICIELTFFTGSSTEVGYILDIEGRYAKRKDSTQSKDSFKSLPIIFVWRSRNRSPHLENYGPNITNYEFREIIKALALYGSKALSLGYFPKSCQVQYRKHNDSMIALTKLAEELFLRKQSDDD